LQQLERAYFEAQQAGIPCSLITDSGHVMLPHFDGSPVVTAVGIGPCTRQQANHFLKHFKLL
jgi:peptidyl-tRNA hydrolase